MKGIEVIVEKTNTGFSAYAKDYPVATTGDTLEELTNNILEVINFYFEEMSVSKRIITDKDIKLTLDIPNFFKFYNIINVKILSERIGMDQNLLSAYTNGLKKPTPTKARRILNGVQKIGKELADINLFV